LPDLVAPPREQSLGADRRARRPANLAVTANTYSHVLADEAELDYAELLEAD
jgi:hypothetical protein